MAYRFTIPNKIDPPLTEKPLYDEYGQPHTSGVLSIYRGWSLEAGVDFSWESYDDSTVLILQQSAYEKVGQDSVGRLFMHLGYFHNSRGDQEVATWLTLSAADCLDSDGQIGDRFREIFGDHVP